MAAAPPSAAPAATDCPRCGSPRAALQEYCLECGQRLPIAFEDVAAGGSVSGWSPGALARAWPVLVALVVAVLAAATVLTVRVSDDPGAETLVTPLDAPLQPPLDEEVAEPEAGEPAVRELTPPPAPTTAPTRPRQAPDARGAALTQWPAGTDGFTVVLASLPDVDGRAAATSKAKAASKAGLREVGVLDSDEYASLHPGYYVVFSGIYSTRSEAERAIEGARSSGYADAYAAEVAQ